MASTLARRLRKNPTEAERRLWSLLRNRQLENCRFRRQAPIGRHIVDFVCFDRRPVVEADGGQHAIRTQEDERRTRWLASQGFRVLRFWNQDVLRDSAAVVELIRHILLESDTPHPNPPPQGGRE